VALGGAFIRLFAALQFRPHVDEGNSLLAAHMVADRGVPVLPSGVLYLHGATLSYLASPLVRLDPLGDANLLVPRLVSVVAGTVAIILTYLLTRMIGVPAGMAVLAAFLIAVDPQSILWGGRFRMYSLLQVIVLLLACCFVITLSARPPSRASLPRLDRASVGVVVGFWLAVFTHLSAALLWPALFLASWVVLGRGLLRDRRGLLGMLGLCLLAQLVFIIAGSAVGPGNSSSRPGQGVGLSFGSFLGDDAVSTRELLQPSLAGWTMFFDPGWFASLVPVALAILSGLVVGRSVTGSAAEKNSTVSSSGLAAIVSLYWVPILIFAFIADEPRERYLLYIQPVGAALVAAALTVAVGMNRDAGQSRIMARMSAAGVFGLGAIVVVNLVTGVFSLDDRFQENDPSPIPALRYVVANRAPDDFIVVTAPPESYLVLGNADHVSVVGGALSIGLADGSEVDYWIGWPKLRWQNLCRALSDHPQTWVVMSADHLESTGKMTEVMNGATDVVWSAEDGMLVLRSRKLEAWDPAARETCT